MLDSMTLEVSMILWYVASKIPFFVGSITIPYAINLTVTGEVSDPQFTLTCISTGGPATTVTWTRDSVTVTEGNKTVLDDPETAQYTHTLTLTEGKGGLYTCTVANSRPSNDSSSFTVKGRSS